MDGTGAVGRLTIGALGLWAALESFLLAAVTPLALVFPAPLTRAIGPVNAAAMLVLLVCMILFSIWSYRAMARAHRREPGLTISPAWSVGWYFVPVACLWKPYQAMREIWAGNAADPRDATHAPLVVWWWAAWVVRSVLDPALYALSALPRSRTPIDLMFLLHWGGSIADIAAAILLIVIIRRVDAMGAGQADASVFD